MMTCSKSDQPSNDALTDRALSLGRRCDRRGGLGFTLVELMIVVTIVGVLSTLGFYGVRRYISSAKTSEATTVLASIRGAQELYKQETFVYLDVSEGQFSKLHPWTTPIAEKRRWDDPDGSVDADTTANFRTLGVESDGPVYFTYGCVAGVAGTSIPEPPTTKKDFKLPDPSPEPYYVAVAKGDVDGDGAFTWLLTHNMTNEVYIENE